MFRYDGKFITNLKPNGDDWAWPPMQDKKGNIWFSNWNGAYRFDGKSFIKIDGLSMGNSASIQKEFNTLTLDNELEGN